MVFWLHNFHLIFLWLTNCNFKINKKSNYESSTFKKTPDVGSPLAIGYIVKKYEQKQAKKQQEKAMAKNTAL